LVQEPRSVSAVYPPEFRRGLVSSVKLGARGAGELGVGKESLRCGSGMTSSIAVSATMAERDELQRLPNHEQERETLKRAVTLFVRETRSALTLAADRGAAAARHGDLAARPDASRWGDPQRRAE
jgi:hypothetical protein